MWNGLMRLLDENYGHTALAMSGLVIVPGNELIVKLLHRDQDERNATFPEMHEDPSRIPPFRRTAKVN